MVTVLAWIARPAAMVLSPWVGRQALRMQSRSPRLSTPTGGQTGIEPGSAPTGPGDAIRLLVVGDSTAAGVGVQHILDALPCRLAAELARVSLRSVHWTVSARAGATAGYTARKLVPIPDGEHDLVVVVVGVNDAVQFIASRHWRGQMAALVELLTHHLSWNGRIVLMGLPDLGRFGVFPQPLRTLVGWQAETLDRQLRILSARHDRVWYVPAPAACWPEMFAEDSFHPNAAAYRAWARHLAAALANPSTSSDASGHLSPSQTRLQMIYDGDCAFCTSAAAWGVRTLAAAGRPLARTMPFQQLDPQGVDAAVMDQARREVLWIAADGRVHGGVSAVAQWCRHRGGGWWYLAVLLKAPLLSHVADVMYRLVVRHRSGMAAWTER